VRNRRRTFPHAERKKVKVYSSILLESVSNRENCFFLYEESLIVVRHQISRITAPEAQKSEIWLFKAWCGSTLCFAPYADEWNISLWRKWISRDGIRIWIFRQYRGGLVGMFPGNVKSSYFLICGFLPREIQILIWIIWRIVDGTILKIELSFLH